MNILEELAAHARMRAAEDKKRIPLEEMREQAQRLQCTEGNPFAATLKKPGLSFICEVKRASPSKGLIAPLICALLDTGTVARYLELCRVLGLAALVEAHNETEVASAVSAGARIIGVNNRNLKDFTVDFSNAARLRDRIPPECLYVAESGVKGPEDIAALRSIGADAALVGETLMRSEDKRAMLAAFREAAG